MGNRLLTHIRGNLVAYLALFFALAGTSVAATDRLLPRNSVGSRQVINGSLEKVDLSKKAVTALQGSRGARGPAGDQGPAGTPGQPGAVGPKGDTGPQGAAGSQGTKGDTGATGAAGSQGTKGDTGATGAAGPAATPLIWSAALASIGDIQAKTFPTIGPFTLDARCFHREVELRVTSQEASRFQVDGLVSSNDQNQLPITKGAEFPASVDTEISFITTATGEYERAALHVILASNSGHVLDVHAHTIADNRSDPGSCAIDGIAVYAP